MAYFCRFTAHEAVIPLPFQMYSIYSRAPDRKYEAEYAIHDDDFLDGFLRRSIAIRAAERMAGRFI